MEKVINEFRVIETDDGYRIEIKGDKERLKKMFSGRKHWRKKHRRGFGPFGFGFMPGPWMHMWGPWGEHEREHEYEHEEEGDEKPKKAKKA
jgi:hypothetical protein